MGRTNDSCATSPWCPDRVASSKLVTDFAARQRAASGAVRHMATFAGIRFVPRTEPTLTPSRTVVDDEERKRFFWRRVQDMWQLELAHFPGAHPMPFTPSDLNALAHNKHVVALKTDGVRFLLLLCMDVDDAPVALMIDRAGVMYEISVWAENSFFAKGTLVEGELVWNVKDDTLDGTMTLYVFDAVVVAGVHVAAHSFSQRLQFVHDTLFRAWREMSAEELMQHVEEERRVVSRQKSPFPIEFVAKPFFALKHVADVWASRATATHRTDGLIFARKDAPMDVGRTRHMLKWKHIHTLDLRLCNTERGLVLRVDDDCDACEGVCPCFALCTEPNGVCDAVATDMAVGASAICECVVAASRHGAMTHVAFPIRRRDDKNKSNSMRTIVSTLSGEDVEFEAIRAAAVSESPAQCVQRWAHQPCAEQPSTFIPSSASEQWRCAHTRCCTAQAAMKKEHRSPTKVGWWRVRRSAPPTRRQSRTRITATWC